MKAAVFAVAAAWGLGGCGGGQDLPQPLATVCRASDAACQRAAAAAHDRACWVMPAGVLVYMGSISDALLRQELVRLGMWEVGDWIEGEDCE